MAEIVPLAGGNLRGVKWIGPEADLRGADMEGAIASLQVRTMEGATMPDGSKYEEWIKRQETENGEGRRLVA